MNNFQLTNKMYDALKRIATVWLPAIATLIFAVFEIWKFDMALAGQIVGTISAIETFLAMLLGISTANWKAGQ